jgi:hypothetical protein
MGGPASAGEDLTMIETIETQTGPTGRSLGDPAVVVGEARRLVGLERHHHRRSCGADRRTWTRMSSCPDCGEAFQVAVIHRAAISGA